MKLSVIDFRMPQEAQSALEAFGYTLCQLPLHKALDTPVSAHPDMLLFFATDAIYCTAEYKKTALDRLETIARHTQKQLIPLDRKQRKDYPHDILFNAAVVGKHLFCLPSYTAKEILHSGQYTPVPVKQGYAKCSILPVGNNALITEDPSIAKAASARGLDVLKISPNGVSLSGYSTGFLGGSASYSPYRSCEDIFFCGDLNLHPDAREIREFCTKHNKNPISLGAFPLTDVGTIFLL